MECAESDYYVGIFEMIGFNLHSFSIHQVLQFSSFAGEIGVTDCIIHNTYRYQFLGN